MCKMGRGRGLLRRSGARPPLAGAGLRMVRQNGTGLAAVSQASVWSGDASHAQHAPGTTRRVARASSHSEPHLDRDGGSAHAARCGAHTRLELALW